MRSLLLTVLSVMALSVMSVEKEDVLPDMATYVQNCLKYDEDIAQLRNDPAPVNNYKAEMKALMEVKREHYEAEWKYLNSDWDAIVSLRHRIRESRAKWEERGKGGSGWMWWKPRYSGSSF